MIQKISAVCFFLAVIWSQGFGQVTIVPMPHQEGHFSIDDIGRMTLISLLTQPVDVTVAVKIENEQHQLVFSSVSPSFILQQGTNRPEFNQSGTSFKYGTGKSATILKSTGRLPYGNYIFCYEVYQKNNNQLLGEYCDEEPIKPFGPPELVSPYDGEVIDLTRPLLTWRAPFPPGITPFDYTLRLCELKPDQTSQQAIERNTPILQINSLSGTMLPYPGNAQSLEIGKKYVWQVQAFSNGYNLGVTDVWAFEVNLFEQKSQVLVPPNTNFRTYYELKLAPNIGFHPMRSKKLRFAFDNRYGATSLDYLSGSGGAVYEIYPEGNRTTALSITPGSVSLIAGLNKVFISLPVAGFTDGQNYLLVVRDITGKEYYLDFTYVAN